MKDKDSKARWRKVLVQVRDVSKYDGGGTEIRINGDKHNVWEASYIGPRTAQNLVEAILEVANDK